MLNEFDKIASQQGWNSDSVIGVLRDFIVSNGLSEPLAVFAQEVADQENETAENA